MNLNTISFQDLLLDLYNGSGANVDLQEVLEGDCVQVYLPSSLKGLWTELGGLG